jgi:catechol 2,3-dioxygenase-like lactoylglutathione lyase family enzyme
MPTHFCHVVIDAADAGASARWWGEALGWPVVFEEPDEVVIEPPEADGVGFPLVFLPVPEPKRGKNRVHLDLRSASDAEQADLVERLVRQGANPADIGQRDTPWVVLADPEGNEFCVLDPREFYTATDTGAIAAIVVDAVDPPALARFWAEATGWDLARSSAAIASLRDPAGTGPFIEFVHVAEPNPVKNRLHLDVAPFAGGNQAAEVARLRSLGATPADVGQGDDVTWVVLADPEGNEFCVLSPR